MNCGSNDTHVKCIIVMHGALRTWCNCDCECAAEKKAVTFLVHSHFAIVFAIFVHIVLVHGISCLCVKVAGN